MTPDDAAEVLERLLRNKDGVVSVKPGKGCVLVRVSGKSAALGVRSTYGGGYGGCPVVVERESAAAGILTVYPDA